VNAVTTGAVKVISATDGVSTIVLSGTDGATYTYRDVTPALRGTAAKMKTAKAGTRIGISGPGGLTFAISVPDVRGLVDADEAIQAWSSGLAINVRSLPSTVVPASAPARGRVLIVTDSGTNGTGSALGKSLTGPLVQVRTATVSGADRLGSKSPLARRVAAPGGSQLVIVALAKGTPAQAASLAELIRPGHQLLWVAPPGTSPQEAAAYRAVAAARSGFRVESLPLPPTPAKAAPLDAEGSLGADDRRAGEHRRDAGRRTGRGHSGSVLRHHRIPVVLDLAPGRRGAQLG
jgi:hypothetical protein